MLAVKLAESKQIIPPVNASDDIYRNVEAVDSASELSGLRKK